MTASAPDFRVRLLAVAAAAALMCGSAQAQDAAPKPTVTEQLIRLLTERQALSAAESQLLLQQLAAEQAELSRLRAQVAAQPAAAGAPTAATPAAPGGTVRVMYIPETEKQKIRDQVKDEVMAQARTENWAQPDALPAWTRRISLSGDLRLRQQFDLFDDSNDPLFIDFADVNGGSPLDVNPPAGEVLRFPFLNTTEDRSRTRIRARLGLDAKLADDTRAELRIATGGDSPISRNVTLGSESGAVQLLLDRAALHYSPLDSLALHAGRMGNPLLSSELVYDDDLSLDGLAGRWTLPGERALRPFVTLGGFNIASTDTNFPGNSSNKLESRDKWLLAAQLGALWQIAEQSEARFALGYHDFINLEGELSSPCLALESGDACDSDYSRPGFQQQGNTLFALRDLLVDSDDPNGPQYQYFGYATPFRVLDATAQLDTALSGPLHLVATLHYAANLAYDRDEILARVPVNNYAACDLTANPDCDNAFEGGSDAWLFKVLVGYPSIATAGEWNLAGGLRRLESDAVPDGFTDSDFGLGGTNAQGFFFGGAYGFAPNTSLSARWISSKEVSGPPLAVELLQLDLNVRF